MASGWHGRFLALYLAGHITLSRALSCEGIILLDNILRPFIGILPSEALERALYTMVCGVRL